MRPEYIKHAIRILALIFCVYVVTQFIILKDELRACRQENTLIASVLPRIVDKQYEIATTQERSYYVLFQARALMDDFIRNNEETQQVIMTATKAYRGCSDED
jgi:hypothetical protein